METIWFQTIMPSIISFIFGMLFVALIIDNVSISKRRMTMMRIWHCQNGHHFQADKDVQNNINCPECLMQEYKENLANEKLANKIAEAIRIVIREEFEHRKMMDAWNDGKIK